MKRRKVIKKKIVKISYLPKYSNANTSISCFDYDISFYDLQKKIEVDGEYKH